MSPALLGSIMEKKQLDDELKGQIKQVLGEFKQRFVADKKAVATSA